MSSSLDPRHTFATFVVGPSNRLAAAAARRVAEAPGSSYSPLVIHSAAGLGKTHILHGVGQLALSVQPELAVRYETIEALIDRVTLALTTVGVEELRAEYATVDLLLLDDIQFLAGRARTQEELLRLWDVMSRRGAQIVLASDRPPQEIDELDARLISRISGGLIVDLSPPEVETRTEILRREAADRGVALSEEVLEAIARLAWESVRELQGGFNRVVAVQDSEARMISVAEVAPLLGVRPAPGASEDEFSAFLSDLAVTVSQLVESAPWRRRVGEAILRWEGDGIRTSRLDEALDADSAPDVDMLLSGFEADVTRLREIAAALRDLAPEVSGSPILTDPERLRDAESLLSVSRMAASPLLAPPGATTLADIGSRYGEGSAAARAARRAVGRPAAEHNPLLVHGADCSGRTGFLSAVAAGVHSERPDARVAYLPAGVIANELAPALRAGAPEIWRRRYGGVELLLLDDLQEVGTDPRLQEELFYLIDALLRSEVQVVASADRIPGEIDELDSRLKGRLEGGAIVRLDLPPAEPETALVAVIEKERGPETDDWYYNPEKIGWTAMAMDDRMIEEL